MSPSVFALPQEMRLATAARLLRQDQVSGAPVIDAAGHCVGVLSTTDFMRWAEDRPRRPLATADALEVEWEVVESDDLCHDEVRDHMTANLVTVTPDTGIVQIAQMMLDGHIHRLIVLDEQSRPIGIVSTTDLLAAVARGNSAIPNDAAR